jgi:hypothetical protein
MAEPATAQIEGLVEAVTVGVAFFVVIIKFGIRKMIQKQSTLPMCGVDLLHGTVVTPFLLMIGAVFWTPFHEYLRTTSPVTTAIAGGIGLFFVLFELRKLD